MLTGTSLNRFRENLVTWFSQFQRDLPWRHTQDPYPIWLSEVMLQQTRVVAAIPYFERFLERFPTVGALAAAPQEEVLRLWSGLGYYSRARNLQRAAQEIVNRHNSKFPEDWESALQLPGIGNYTAAAVLSIAYGKQFAVLDGNVARVLARLLAIRGDLRANGTWQELQQTANQLLEAHAPGNWNQALMELGATLCTPRSPQCLLCPVSEFCEARKQGLVELIPEKRKKRSTVEITLASVVFCNPNNRTLLLPPPKSNTKSADADDIPALLSRMWHFPTVSFQGEPEPHLKKHLQKTFLKWKANKIRLIPLKTAHHAVTYRSITIFPFRMDVEKLPKVPGSKSLPLSDLSSIAISNLTRKVARAAISSL